MKTNIVSRAEATMESFRVAEFQCWADEDVVRKNGGLGNIKLSV